MEKSEKSRLDHNPKKKKHKGKSKKKQEQTKENNPYQNNILLNGEVSIIQNQLNQNQKKKNLPFQEADSYNQIQKQNMINSQSNPNSVIMINPGVEAPSAADINNQQDHSKIRLRSKPQEITCPYCHQNMKTSVEEEFNCASFIIYSLSFFLFPPLFLYFMTCATIEECKCIFSCEKYSWTWTFCFCCCDCDCCCYYLSCCSCPEKDKDGQCCFCDIEHYCSNCGKLIGRRDSLHLCPPCCCSSCR